jgi:hypothetical protein
MALAESSVLSVAIASLCISTIAFVFAAYQHSKYHAYPSAMGFYLRILLLPWLFTMLALFEALFDAKVEHILEVVRAVFEAVAIFYFVRLFSAVAGGNDVAVNALDIEAPTIFRCIPVCTSCSGKQRFLLINILTAQVHSPASLSSLCSLAIPLSSWIALVVALTLALSVSCPLCSQARVPPPPARIYDRHRLR